VDLPRLAKNLAFLRTHLNEGTGIALVAKADAYGHGLVPVSRFAAHNGADWIAVATVQEGIALRDAGLECPIIVLSPMLPIEADQGVFYGIDLMVENLEIAQALNDAAQGQGRRARVHMKVDTGLHRFGCHPDVAVRLATEINRLPAIDLIGIAQHFIDSSTSDEATQSQLSAIVVIEQAVEAAIGRKLMRHRANSAGAMRFPDSQGDLIRVGILAYGIDPFDLTAGGVEPVLQWQARITSLRNAEAGESIGYNATYTLTRQSRIATVGAGYGDGYPRRLSNCGYVSISGQRANVIGLVCMDQLMIDVTDLPQVKVGDVADLIGPEVKVSDLARLAETNSHEIVTRIMSRVPRRYRYPD